MSQSLPSLEIAKKAAARRALNFVRDGMTVGLGTGSTAKYFVQLLATKIIEEKIQIKAVPTSKKTLALAKDLSVPLSNLNSEFGLDLVVDGADEADSQFNLIKGGGGALLQEKIVASASRKMIVICDYSKKVNLLGKFPLPLEVVKFGADFTRCQLRNILSELGYRDCALSWRMNGEVKFNTDEGHYLLDAYLDHIVDPKKLQQELISCPGLVETGLFINLAKVIIWGNEDGSTEIVEAV